MEIEIIVREKVARLANKHDFAVCGNSDYKIKFDFDSEWDAYEVKTARFKYNGTYADVVFNGCECPMPIITSAFRVEVGVYAGDLRTTSCAVLPLKKSILCGSETESKESQEIKDSINKILKEKIDSPQKAEIGEVLTVEEVDENGKPTKWKTAPAAAEQKQADWGQNDEGAADFVRNRTHYDSRVIKTIEKTFENIAKDKMVKLAEADIDINRIISFSFTRSYMENDVVQNSIITVTKDDIFVDDVSHLEDMPEGSVLVIVSKSKPVNLIYFATPVEKATDGESTDTYHGLYGTVYAGDILDKFKIEIHDSGELKTIDPKYINDMYYTETEEMDIAGHTIPNVNYKGDHDVYPFELGQVWNAKFETVSYENLEVKKLSSPGGDVYYIGDLEKSSPPFYITATTADANSSWLGNLHPGDLTLTAVSGKVTRENIHTIPEKYMPPEIYDDIADVNRSVDQKIKKVPYIPIATTTGSGSDYKVTIDGFTPTVGSMLVIIPHVTSNSYNPYLSINGANRKYIKYGIGYDNGAESGFTNAKCLKAGYPALIMMNQNEYVAMGLITTNQYRGSITTGYCTTDANVATKVVKINGKVLLDTIAIFAIYFKNGNTAINPKIQLSPFQFVWYIGTSDMITRDCTAVEPGMINAGKWYLFMYTTGQSNISGGNKFILLNPDEPATDLVISSSTEGSSKKFKITVDDNGTLSAAEVNT